jgi:hypothetical protein
MLNVKNRSPESWGPLAAFPENRFNQIIENRRGNTKQLIKEELKKAKKLKTYKVSFIKEWRSDQFELQAESDYDVSAVAREYFKLNRDKIGFKEKRRASWEGEPPGYDSISYVKVRSY